MVSRIEEIDKIYDLHAGLNPKFDVVQGCILCQRPIPSLMEVCSKIHLKEYRTSAMNISATRNTIYFAAFSARSFTSGSHKHNGKPVPVCEHCKKQWHTKEQCWMLHGCPPGSKKRPPNDK